ncbi:hypothetical protein [[Mycoplasma] mobile]|uniref:Expressed protein n=1 Tax=Mycoplasma mobile (strain ATCC 43663 / 163K / NCTC 11711) TaxID=267748 RepID=Q6KH98_MYCM1|nr:hypothetical protein [[Mycoplasma] mobile]AAT28032.1 expressed protein [Mycoplasma mobile 163K]
MRKKLLIGSIIASTAAVSILIAVPVAIFSMQQIEIQPLNLNQKLSDVESNYLSKENDLENYSRLHATEMQDNVLVYYNSWDGVIQRMSQFSSLLKILEINPNKKIYILSNYDEGFSNKNYSLITAKYKNVIFKKIPNANNASRIDSWSNAEFENIKLENPGKKFDIFMPAEVWYQNAMKFVSNIKNNDQDGAVAIIDKYKAFFEFNSIAFITDGSAERTYIDDNIFNFYSFSKNKFNSATKTFQPSIDLKKKFLQNEPSFELNIQNASLLWQSLVSNDENNLKPNSTSQNVFFFASTDMIRNLNDSSTSSLSLNDSFSGWFDPFYSSNLRILKMYTSLSQESKTLFLSVINSSNIIVENSLDDMNNNLNIVYSGNIIFDNDISNSDLFAETEATRILSLLNKTITENPNQPIHQIKFIFKGHPRDRLISEGQTLDYIKTLREKVEMRKNLFESTKKLNQNEWLRFWDKNIPFEFYLLNGFIENNPLKNKLVKMYTQYSTILHLLESEDLLNTVSNIIISEEGRKNIVEKFYGNSSKIIDSKKILIL